jgi:Fe-S-cluster-containing dehydrogenase component
MPQLYSLIEKGTRAVVCRRCENPACISVCPCDAIEKPDDKDLIRYPMKCVACKQCSNACPVGANPLEILKHKVFPGYKLDIARLKKICSENAVDEAGEIPEGFIVVDDLLAVKAMDWK